MPRRVLLISYPFPPVGGAGVQRVTKLLKYLPQHGWECSVLTVDNPSVPVFDHSLAADIPAETIVRRARTLEPGYALKAAVSSGGRASSHASGAPSDHASGASSSHASSAPSGHASSAPSHPQTGGSGGSSGRGRLARRFKDAARVAANLVLQPDAQVLWLPHALRTGGRLLREVPHQAIFASGPPFSTFLLAARLARRHGVPLVLDYRDEWGLSNQYWENKRQPPLALAWQRRMQRRVVRQAAALVATTTASCAALEAVAREAGCTPRIECIYNGFDPEDFATPLAAVAHEAGTPTAALSAATTVASPSHVGSGAAPLADEAAAPDRFQLVYTGTLWQLTDIGPVVSAVERLAQRAPALAARLELVVAGRSTPEQQRHLDRLADSPVTVTRHDYLDHHRAVELVRRADLLLLLLSDLPGAGRVVPAKLFEYLAARRPILAVCPEGEVWQLLAGHPAAHCIAPSDETALCAVLTAAIGGAAGAAAALDDWDIGRFDRSEQAGQLARLLEAIVPAGA